MSIMSQILDFFNMDNWEDGIYKNGFVNPSNNFDDVKLLLSRNVIEESIISLEKDNENDPSLIDELEVFSPTEAADAKPLILEDASHILVEPQNKTISNDEETLPSTESIIGTNNTSQIDEIEKVNPIEEPLPIPKEIKMSVSSMIAENENTHSLKFMEAEPLTQENAPIKVTEPILNSSITIEEPVQAHEDYLSQRMVIRGVHLQFISVARDIVNHNSIDELRTKHFINISSEDYERILQELMDAKIIDTAHNILMSTDTLEHFIDIYEPSLFHLQRSHGTFDKDIFICLGELLLQNDIDYAKSCFSSIDELLDYLSIMEELHLLEFKDGKYRITYSLEEFKTICKGVPEYYNNAKAAVPQSNNISSIDYDSLDGPEFEQYCADILLQNNYQNVTLTKASGDHGIDILAEKDDITYAIQCKCYSSNIGNAAIQQAFTGKKLYRKDIAVVLTNQYFTQQAQEEASSLGVKLWDRDKLNQMIEKINK